MISVEEYRLHGWLVVPQALGADQLAELDRAVDELETWAASDGPGLHHFEQTDAGAVIARSEDFVDHSRALRSLICDGIVVEVLTELFGEDPVLFKEKINYKHPGGGGFAPHQDAPAYRFVDHHISCMVPLDPATEASGCLWVAPGHERGVLATDDRGRIDEATATMLEWRPVPLAPGDLLFFDSYTPHFSDTNRTDRPRRAAYLTYNAASRGDHRARYYADKRAEFARAGGDFDGERVRISISDDFLGRPVPGGTSGPSDDMRD
jgi:ectoine hydroxylase-related dioxygenase (phytanoyl-CoA dioxygenase family)